MVNDVSEIDTLRCNAKIIGGIVGPEEEFLDRQNEEEGDVFFIDKPTLDLQNIKFTQIEKTTLGRGIKSIIEKLEGKNKDVNQKIQSIQKYQA